MIKLSRWQKFLLKINGSVFIGHEHHRGWSEPNAIYVVRCRKHGLYSGTRHGWYDQPPQCPDCMKELMAKALLLNQKV